MIKNIKQLLIDTALIDNKFTQSSYSLSLEVAEESLRLLRHTNEQELMSSIGSVYIKLLVLAEKNKVSIDNSVELAYHNLTTKESYEGSKE